MPNSNHLRACGCAPSVRALSLPAAAVARGFASLLATRPALLLLALALVLGLAEIAGAQAQVIFRDSFGTGGAGGGTFPFACANDPDPLVAPAGFIAHDVPWQQAFFGYQYPLSGGSLAAIGSWTLRDIAPVTGPPIAGRYISIPLVPDHRTHKLEWGLVQTTMVYPLGRGASSVFVSISPCPGDLRAADNASADPFEHRACRRQAYQGGIYYGPEKSTSNTCQLQTGQTYYINVLFADPSDGLSVHEDTCSGIQSRCEANFKHN